MDSPHVHSPPALILLGQSKVEKKKKSVVDSSIPTQELAKGRVSRIMSAFSKAKILCVVLFKSSSQPKRDIHVDCPP